MSPPTLPALTHADAALDLNYTGAGIGQGSLSAFTWMAQVAGEVPLTNRHWHAGGAWDLVSAAAEGRGRALLYGNPELWVRGVGWHESGLSAGGGLGVIAPLPRDLSRDSQAVLDVIRVIRPWDSGYFESETLTPATGGRCFAWCSRRSCSSCARASTGHTPSIVRAPTSSPAPAPTWGSPPSILLTLGTRALANLLDHCEVEDDKRAAFTLSPSIRVKLARSSLQSRSCSR
jgi:hypothetical protein